MLRVSRRDAESIEIRPRIASYVTRIAFEEGETVEQGQLLVELENSEIVAGLYFGHNTIDPQSQIALFSLQKYNSTMR